MSFLDLAKKRYSTRGYEKRAIEQHQLEAILSAAALAPTAANKQPFQFIVIHTEGKEEQLKKIYNRDWFVQAPIVICACSIAEQAWNRLDGKNYADIDTTIAMDHLTLAATELGLGTCWVAAFNPDAAREVLSIPSTVNPVAFTPLGYPTEGPHPRHDLRKPLTDIVRYEHW